MKKKYPLWCCAECGVSANVLTAIRKYKKRPRMLANMSATYHFGVCDVCKEKRLITQPRDFFYPDFSLLFRNHIIRYDHIQN